MRTATKLRSEIVRNSKSAGSLRRKAAYACSYGSYAYVEAIQNAKEALAQAKADRAELASVLSMAPVAAVSMGTKTFQAIYADYAKQDATDWATERGYAILALGAKQLTGATDGFNDWVATLVYAVY